MKNFTKNLSDALKELRKYTLALVLVFIIFEILSFLIAKRIGIDTSLYYIQASGYYCYGNATNHRFTGQKGLPNNTYQTGGEVLLDEYGFVVKNPIALKKGNDALRVIIEGGSAAWGSGQSRSIVKDSSYFEVLYVFESSIAGLLQKELEDSLPGKKIEVINGAVVGHSIYQHFAKYQATDHLFSPDIIITFAGYNDITDITSNDYYTGEEKMLDAFIDLEAEVHSKRFPFSAYLGNYFVNTIIGRNTGGELADQGKKNQYWIDSDYSHDYEYYQSIEPRLADNSQELFRIIDAYSHQVQKDGGYHLFYLQPLLSRIDIQKPLTPLEKKLRDACEETEIGSIAQYYFGEFFAPRVDSIMRKNKGEFVDMGKIIAEQSDVHTEIYTDYCHLTFRGNQLCAHDMAQRIVHRIRTYQ